MGNKVFGKWVTVGMTLEAATTLSDQSGEQEIDAGEMSPNEYYCKTQYRVVIERQASE